MAGVRKRGEMIRDYIVQNVSAHRRDITSFVAKKFKITRQAVHHHIRRLVDQKEVSVSGSRSQPIYELVVVYEKEYKYLLDGTLEEDVIWRKAVLPHLSDLPENVIALWEYGVTEMINNAIDHSLGQHLSIFIERFRPYIEISILDDGVGIFKKITAAMNLDDERHAVLELAKGKFTTDPDNHTGEGIFFSSRICDQFNIWSGDVYYAHDFDDPSEWIAKALSSTNGTLVWMKLGIDCDRSVKNIFDEYAAPDDYAFTKTVVPVDLAEYGDSTLVSRSQAKRLLTRIDRFTTVIFDFENVGVVGQSFADEIFRVFANRHPDIEISAINANKKVKNMIARARAPRD